MTVRDNVAFGLTIRKRPKAEIRSASTSCSSSCSWSRSRTATRRSSPAASGSAWRSPARSRSSPKVLLLDEPFGALDARVRTELREWLRRLHDEVHVTTVFVTHDQEEAMEVADQIAVMNHGRIEQVGGPRELYEQPANEFVMSFVGAGQPRRRHLGAAARPRAAARRRTDGADEAMIERIVHLGFEVRVELVARRRREALGAADARPGEELELRGGPDRLRPRRSTSGSSALGDVDRSTRSASEVSSSTPRMLARSSIQTSRSAVAAPVYVDVLRPRAAHVRDRPLDRADRRRRG